MSLPGRRGTRTLPDARSRSRAMCPTHERTTRWQVSWLADRRFLAAFPEKSPVACGPQAPGLQLRVQPRNCTEFPLGRPTGQHHLLALSGNGQACVNSPCLVVGWVCMRTSLSGVAGRRADRGWPLGACAVGIHGCKSALIRPFGRSISSNMTRYSPQSIGRRDGDSEFSLSRIPTAQAPSDAEGTRYLLRSARSPATGDRPPAGSWP